MSKPILFSGALFATMHAWNEYMFATVFVESDKLKTVPVGLVSLQTALRTDYPAFDCRIDNIRLSVVVVDFSGISKNSLFRGHCTGRRERMKKMRILGLGDCCVDYYIHKKMAFPGGNAFNVAVYAAENGAEAGFLGTVGDDVIGEHILKCARENACRYFTLSCEAWSIRTGCGQSLLMVTEYLLVVILKKNHGVGSLYPPMLSSADLNYVESFQLVHSSCYAHVENQIERVRAFAGRSGDSGMCFLWH